VIIPIYYDQGTLYPEKIIAMKSQGSTTGIMILSVSHKLSSIYCP